MQPGNERTGPPRESQTFYDDESWVSAYKLDSATSRWCIPCPIGVVPGDNAVWDNGLEVSPLATAFVTHDDPESPSYIHLAVYDDEWERQYDTYFSAPEGLTGCPESVCRYPAVEVTYSRSNPSSGLLQVHMIWQQLAGSEGDHWNLYYRTIWFTVTATGVNWGNPGANSPIVSLGPQVNTGDDEIHPDLAIAHALGRFLLVYNRTVTPPWETGAIWAVTGQFYNVFPPAIGVPYQLSDPDNDSHPKCAPKVEVQVINSGGSPVVQADAVWTEKIIDPGEPTDYKWDVFFKEWNAAYPASSGGEMNLSNSTYTRVNACPNLALCRPGGPTPTSYCNVVIAWTHAIQLESGDYSEPRVYVVVSPEFTEINNIDDGLMPDVAPYPTNPEVAEGWFALSYYRLESEEPPVWQTVAKSCSFTVDWQAGDVTVTQEDEYVLPDSDSLWTYLEPFTGASICLRVPDADDLPSSEFGLGWIDKEPSESMAWLSHGLIP